MKRNELLDCLFSYGLSLGIICIAVFAILLSLKLDSVIPQFAFLGLYGVGSASLAIGMLSDIVLSR